LRGVVIDAGSFLSKTKKNKGVDKNPQLQIFFLLKIASFAHQKWAMFI
jgi:hypothetical protein